MQRLSRIETAVIAAGIDNTRRTSSLFNYETGPMPEDRQERTHILGWTMLTRTKLLNSLARYDGHLSRRFFRGVELMIDIRREERQLREAREAREAQPGYNNDPPLVRYVLAESPTPSPQAVDSIAHVRENIDPTPVRDIGFRPAIGKTRNRPNHQLSRIVSNELAASPGAPQQAAKKPGEPLNREQALPRTRSTLGSDKHSCLS